jgi:hypothetical protein
MAPIYAEKIAAKLAALKNLQAPAFAAALAREPRHVELAWHLQYASMQPGGLEKFTESLLARFPHHLGTSAMLAIGKTDQPYTSAERHQIIASFPEVWEFDNLRDASPEEMQCQTLLDTFSREMTGQHPWLSGKVARPDLAFVHKQNHPYFLGYCRRLALAAIPGLLRRFCVEADACLESPFYFHDLQGALLEMIDAHAALEEQNIAETAVTREIFKALQFAWDEKAMVEIVGDSRFGKTESVKAKCKAYPGRARLVITPCDNCERSFFDAIATAAGCNTTFETPLREVKAKVSFVLKYSGLMFVFDEAAWLLPTRFNSRTTPVRLNYVRSLALDNGCPVALVVTPQFFDRAANKFEKTTGFNLAQFKGRIMRRITLPDSLSQQDLLAVVKIHFPDLRESLAKRIVAAALLSDSYLFAVEKISKNARAVAREHGRTRIELEDLERGIALAGIVAPSALKSAPRQTRPAAPAPAPEAPALRAPARQVKPSIIETPV